MTTFIDAEVFSSINSILIGGEAASPIVGSDGNDILLGGEQDDVIDGQAGDDILLGLGGNNSITGGDGNDIITGGGLAITGNGSTSVLTVTVDTNGLDTLTGGAGADRFVLGGNPSTEPNGQPPIIHYDQAGNSDYALIRDFTPEEDIIELGGAKTDYHLAASPVGLPTGTALYRGNELIAILQGAANLDLNAAYFHGSL
ncbi:MAG TPA: hypothetical protein V6C65_40440 [Allocoleopsis sp.]